MIKKQNPYTGFRTEDLILRDHLAIDRTILSNESTLLAYIRTALAVIAGGATLVHFFSESYVRSIGTILIPLGIIILNIGYSRYRIMDKSIKAIQRI